MSLAFLSKKSWHTANICNQEKVWMAEQQKEVEENKIKEIQKTIQVEREREELERISGRISSKIDRGIDWMYEGGANREDDEKNREAEEYLLGKAFEGAPSDDFAAVAGGNVDTIVSSIVDTNNNEADEEDQYDDVQEPQEKDWNEEFRLRHEDPMFLVSSQRQTNLAKTKAKALLEYEQHKISSSSARKKHDKKEKKRHHKHRHKYDDHHRKRSSKSSSRSKNRKRSRYASPRSPSRSPSPPPTKSSKYGLQQQSSSSILHTDNLGPDPKLVQQRKQIADHHRSSTTTTTSTHRSISSSSTRRKLTAEEKAKAVQEMQSHAMKRDQNLQKQASSARNDYKSTSDSVPTSSSSSFINDLKCSVHGVDNDISMADRVQRKRHTNQNLSSGFL